VTASELSKGLGDVAKLRKDGDAAAKMDEQSEAVEKWNLALDRALAIKGALDVSEPAKERAELLGVIGGLHVRLGSEQQALASYEEGAAVEREAALPSFYNRGNEIRIKLLSDEHETLASARPRIEELLALIKKEQQDPAVAAQSWIWAEHADACALLGDIASARTSYKAYRSKAGANEVRVTREALERLYARLKERNDPDASRLELAIGALQSTA
jgi:hypothetical protein